MTPGIIRLLGLYLAMLLLSCSYDAPKPKISTPEGFRELTTNEFINQAEHVLMLISSCKSDSVERISSDLLIVHDTNHIGFKECFYDYLGAIDYSESTVIVAKLGVSKMTVNARMDYKVFINDKTKEIILKSDVTEGGTAGSENESYSWTKAFTVSQFPKDYKVIDQLDK